MRFIETKIKDCLIVSGDRHYDDRGFFQELYQEEKYEEILAISDEKWQQANWSFSRKNVLRGIHVAKYSKLVTCITGKIWDLIVDLRYYSPTYLQYIGIELWADESKQVYVPAGCGHGFVSLEENNCVIYMQSGLFCKQGEFTVKYDDSKLNINWPGQNHIISERDKNAYSLEIFEKSEYIK